MKFLEEEKNSEKQWKKRGKTIRYIVYENGDKRGETAKKLLKILISVEKKQQ